MIKTLSRERNNFGFAVTDTVSGICRFPIVYTPWNLQDLLLLKFTGYHTVVISLFFFVLAISL